MRQSSAKHHPLHPASAHSRMAQITGSMQQSAHSSPYHLINRNPRLLPQQLRSLLRSAEPSAHMRDHGLHAFMPVCHRRSRPQQCAAWARTHKPRHGPHGYMSVSRSCCDPHCGQQSPARTCAATGSMCQRCWATRAISFRSAQRGPEHANPDTGPMGRCLWAAAVVVPIVDCDQQSQPSHMRSRGAHASALLCHERVTQRGHKHRHPCADVCGPQRL